MRLMQLLQANADRPRSFRIEAKGDDEATVYLYDAVGGWFGVLAQDFIKDLQAISAKTIHLRINSPGGDVFEARAIATALSQHKAKVVAHIDGLAASAATYIALAADEVEIAKGAFFMVHQAWTMAMGNSNDLRETATLLDKVDDSIVADYAAATGKDESQIREWMKAETWFTADEAVEHGFADRLYDGATAENRWDLSAYANAPKALEAPPSAAPAAPEAPAPANDWATQERRLRALELYTA